VATQAAPVSLENFKHRQTVSTEAVSVSLDNFKDTQNSDHNSSVNITFIFKNSRRYWPQKQHQFHWTIVNTAKPVTIQATFVSLDNVKTANFSDHTNSISNS